MSDPVTVNEEAPTAGRRLRRLFGSVYAPISAGTIATGMLIPVLPLYLAEIGLTLRTTSVVLAAAGLGAALAGLPVGSLLARHGERSVMIGALAVIAMAVAALGLTDTAIALVALRLGGGSAGAALRLSRQTYITRTVDDATRGRAMAWIGGSFRISLFVGPLLGGLIADRVGFTAAFAVAGALSALGLVPAVLSRPAPARQDPRPHVDGEVSTATTSADPVHVGRPNEGVVTAVRTHRRILLRAGPVFLMVMTVREGRFVVVPLIGDELGLGPAEVGALVTVGTAADLLLFPVSGWLMDAHGRLAAMVPSFGIIAIGLVVLGLATSATAAVVAGAVIGIGNGLGSGVMLTFGSDLAPSDSPGPFLAALAVTQDAGKIVGPLLVGAVGATAGLGAASITLGVAMFLTIAWLVRGIGETHQPSVA
ncbi:MAG: MFS transporter [Actinomycetota bacterium]